jgi:nicotinamide-nucleotide amidase
VAVPGALVALAEELQRACLARGLTVALAESCTGGLVAAAITEVPGSSGYFLGGVVAYSNDAKEAFLGVPEQLLAAHGAVSPEVAGAMAEGARARFGADLAVGVTGVAGPDGGSAEKPVGLVHLGIARAGEVGTIEQRFTGDRPAIREAAAFRTLALLHAHAMQATP